MLSRSRYLLSEFNRMKIKNNKPKDMKMFLEKLEIIRNQKEKAANLLFEEIQREVNERE